MYQHGPYTFSAEDARRTFSLLGELWRHAIHRRDPALVTQMTPAAHDLAARLAEQSGAVAAPADDDAAVRLDRVGEQLAAMVRPGAQGADRSSVEAVLGAAWDGLRTIAAGMARADAHPGAPVTGTVGQLNISGGGVPKRPIARAEVTWRGVVGDSQRARVHHGRPWQALCLWSHEVIDALNAEGHSLTPGAAGENLTLAGVNWESVRPGVVLEIGGVRCEVSSYAVPCSKNAQWFSGGDFERMHHRHGAVSRVYATVLQPGRVSAGDRVLVSC